MDSVQDDTLTVTVPREPLAEYLDKARETGLIIDEADRLFADRRHNDLPYKFYGISDSGREFLKEYKLLRAQDTLREIYDRVEKTEDIKRYETAPRPER